MKLWSWLLNRVAPLLDTDLSRLDALDGVGGWTDRRTVVAGLPVDGPPMTPLARTLTSARGGPLGFRGGFSGSERGTRASSSIGRAADF
jgi:hypothetical protein